MKRLFAALLVLPCVAASGLRAQTLHGSPGSMVRQNSVAHESDYEFLRTPDDVRRAVDSGVLIPVHETKDFTLAGVSFPYTRPELKEFIENVAHGYREACGVRLVVTSLTRPITRQPKNAHELSVHPAGMAMDLHRSAQAKCRNWLEKRLLTMEDAGVIDVTREKKPAHYHVAVFPSAYLAYVGEAPAVVPALVPASVAGEDDGDSLADRHGVSVEALKRAADVLGSQEQRQQRQ